MGSQGLTIALVGATAVGIIVGFFYARRRYRRAVAPPTGLLVPPKVSPEQYQKDRTFYIEMYKTSIQQYDKLVPWVAGGALVVSVPLLRDINTIGGSRFALAVGWLLLLVAVASAVTGHFMSSRIYSSERAALDNVNRADANDEMMIQAAKFHAQAKRSGMATAVLNGVSLVAVVGGLILLGVFAVSLIK